MTDIESGYFHDTREGVSKFCNVFHNAYIPQHKLHGRDADAVNQLLVESLASLNFSSPSIHSSTSKQPVVQVCQDYTQDMLDKMRECILHQGSTVKLRAR